MLAKSGDLFRIDGKTALVTGAATGLGEAIAVALKSCQLVMGFTYSSADRTGTSTYAFCWVMGGENQSYDGMDPVPIPSLR